MNYSLIRYLFCVQIFLGGQILAHEGHDHGHDEHHDEHQKLADSAEVVKLSNRPDVHGMTIQAYDPEQPDKPEDSHGYEDHDHEDNHEDDHATLIDDPCTQISFLTKFILVIIVSTIMFFSAFISGYIPIWMSLSEKRIKNCSALGAGLLLGVAIAVIIPEGIEAVYKIQKFQIDVKNSHSHDMHLDRDVNEHEHADSSIAEPVPHNHDEINTAIYISGSILLGFIFMMLIDNNSEGHVHSHSPMSRHNSTDTHCHDPDCSEGSFSTKKQKLSMDGTNLMTIEEVVQPEKKTKRRSYLNYFLPNRDRNRNRRSEGEEKENIQVAITLKKSSSFVNRMNSLKRQVSTIFVEYKGIGHDGQGTTITLGLIIHAAVDGIAVGATTNSPEMAFLVFLAIALRDGLG